MTKQQMLGRTALAEAIKRVGAAEKELAQKHNALANARNLLSAAEAKCEAALMECDAAKAEHTARVMTAASTASDLKPSTRLRDARIHQAEAQDELEAARDAVAEMEKAVTFEPKFDGTPNDPISAGQRELAAEADQVIRHEVDLTVALDECDRLLAELSDRREAAVWLLKQKLVPPARIAEWGHRLRHRNLPSVSIQSNYSDGQSFVAGAVHTDLPSPMTEAWKAARQALTTDPATPLPPGSSSPAPTTVVPMRKAS